MTESAHDNKKRQSLLDGPAVASEAPVSAVRLPAELTRRIDEWSARNTIETRAEAIQRLVELGLSVNRPHGRRSETQSARAKDMADTAIDGLADETAHPDDKAARKRRLLKGPEEFRGTRIDHSGKGPK